MQLMGRIFEDKGVWVAEVPLIDVYTQGDSREDAASMLADAVESLIGRKGFRASVTAWVGDRIIVGSNDLEVFLPFVLKRCREAGGTSLSDAADALGQSSKTAFARYENGEAMPTISKLEKLLEAISSDVRLVLLDTREGTVPIMETLKKSLRRSAVEKGKPPSRSAAAKKKGRRRASA